MTSSRFSPRDFAFLLAACLLMPFANGRWAFIPIAWIAPALLLRFTRTQPLRHSFLGGLAVLSLANYVWWKSIFPISGVAYVVTATVMGFVALLPYLLDRRFAPRLGGVLGTLVFPAAAVTIELANSLASPFGSWGSFAYSQAGNLPVLQLLSITGLSGVTFLVLWFASVVNSAQTSRPSLLAYGAALGCVLVFGAIRLQSAEVVETTRVASVTPGVPTYVVRGDATNRAVHEALSSVVHKKPLNDAQWADFRKRANVIDDELLASSEMEIAKGARLVVWSEGAGIADTRDEASLIARGAALARRTNAWLELSWLALDRSGQVPFENKNALIDATGNVAWTYRKSHPVPFMEACVPGDGRVPSASTPFGRVATVICYDADFPRLVRQAGNAGVDILLIPADDWREIAPLHSRIATFRAIEQGLSVVRATSNGFSTVVDRCGHVRATSDYASGARTLSALVPSSAAKTIYSRIGDTFGFAVMALLVVLVVRGSMARAPNRMLAVAPASAA